MKRKWSSNKMNAFRFAVVLAACWSDQCHGRPLESWPFEKLFDQADLVVIAAAVSTDYPTEEVGLFQNANENDFLEPVVTRLTVQVVLKGIGEKNQILDFVHPRYKLPAMIPGNGPSLINFDEIPEGLPPDDLWYDGPWYMLFLKKRSDGRYEAVSGQFDPALSIREVGIPGGLAGDEAIPDYLQAIGGTEQVSGNSTKTTQHAGAQHSGTHPVGASSASDQGIHRSPTLLFIVVVGGVAFVLGSLCCEIVREIPRRKRRRGSKVVAERHGPDSASPH